MKKLNSENTIPKAQDFINLFGYKYIEQQTESMICFAKMHVQEALKEASEVLECYPSVHELYFGKVLKLFFNFLLII